MTEHRTPWPLLTPDVSVSPDAPLAGDQLNRKSEVDQLVTLIQNSPTPLVLGVDAAWGTGKTTFVHMLRHTLNGHGYQAIYFDAWETDFVADPLVALVGEVGHLLHGKEDSEVGRKLRSATGHVLKRLAPIAIRLATAGLVEMKPEDLDRLSVEEVEKALSDSAEKVVEATIEQYQQHRGELTQFRKALEKAVRAAGGEKPLIFFIDELDRCRPTFAVELLERIKHLFEISGVIFVLSVHGRQLAHSLRAVYGQQFDAEGYLGRFLHLTYSLAEPAPGDYARFLLKNLSFSLGQELEGSFIAIMCHLRLTLRQTQRCVTRMILVDRMIGRGQRNDNPYMYAALVALREWRRELYEEFMSGKSSVDDVLDALEMANPEGWKSDEHLEWVEASLIVLERGRHRQRRGRTGPPRPVSKRLASYEREKTSDVEGATPSEPTRGARILGAVGHMGDFSLDWLRTTRLLELIGHFQLPSSAPSTR